MIPAFDFMGAWESFSGCHKIILKNQILFSIMIGSFPPVETKTQEKGLKKSAS